MCQLTHYLNYKTNYFFIICDIRPNPLFLNLLLVTHYCNINTKVRVKPIRV